MGKNNLWEWMEYRGIEKGTGNWVYGKLCGNGLMLFGGRVQEIIEGTLCKFYEELGAYEGDVLADGEGNKATVINGEIPEGFEPKYRLWSVIKTDSIAMQMLNHENVGMLIEDVKDEVVVCKETAAELLGLSTGVRQEYVSVYCERELSLPGVECTVVESISDIETVEKFGLRITDEERTLIDVLRENRDLELIYSSLADYYFSHKESFEGLLSRLPMDIQETFEYYREGAIEYYDE